jgi:hypothetical protein
VSHSAAQIGNAVEDGSKSSLRLFPSADNSSMARVKYSFPFPSFTEPAVVHLRPSTLVDGSPRRPRCQTHEGENPFFPASYPFNHFDSWKRPFSLASSPGPQQRPPRESNGTRGRRRFRGRTARPPASSFDCGMAISRNRDAPCPAATRAPDTPSMKIAADANGLAPAAFIPSGEAARPLLI